MVDTSNLPTGVTMGAAQVESEAPEQEKPQSVNVQLPTSHTVSFPAGMPEPLIASHVQKLWNNSQSESGQPQGEYAIRAGRSGTVASLPPHVQHILDMAASGKGFTSAVPKVYNEAAQEYHERQMDHTDGETDESWKYASPATVKRAQASPETTPAGGGGEGLAAWVREQQGKMTPEMRQAHPYLSKFVDMGATTAQAVQNVVAGALGKSVETDPNNPAAWMHNTIEDLGLAGSKLAQILTRRENLALMSAMAVLPEVAGPKFAASAGGALLQAFIDGGFSASMAWSMVQGIGNGIKAAKAGDLREAGRQWADAIGTGTMAGVSGLNAIRAGLVGGARLRGGEAPAETPALEAPTIEGQVNEPRSHEAESDVEMMLRTRGAQPQLPAAQENQVPVEARASTLIQQDMQRVAEAVGQKVPETVGTVEAAKQDTQLFQQARTELEAEAKAKGLPLPTISAIALRAQDMKKPQVIPAGPQNLVQVPENVPGAEVTKPAASYPASIKTGNNPWIRMSNAPNNKGRMLMMQFSTDLIYSQAPSDDAATKYYDKLYSGAREGYSRMSDFWEIPQWMGFVSHTVPNTDVYVVRSVPEAIDFLNKAGYDRIAMSVLDTNKQFVRQIAEGYKGHIDLGGYVEPTQFFDLPHTQWHQNPEALATSMGLPPKHGVDYSHFQGADVIPRLTMSINCNHKCLFCTIPKNVQEEGVESVNQQADAIAKLGAKLVYLNDKTFGQAKNHTYLTEVNKRIKSQNPNFMGFVVQTTPAQLVKMDEGFLRDSGIKYIELGIESFNDEILKHMKKPATENIIGKAVDKLRRLGIALIPNMIIGYPNETAETYQHSLDWLQSIQDVVSHYNIYNIARYEGTELDKFLKDIKSEAAGDFNENVLEKSWHTSDIHETYAGKLYGQAQQALEHQPFSVARHTNEIVAEHNANGGSTFNAQGNQRGKDLYMVSPYPEHTRTIEGELTPGDVEKFANDKYDLLKKPGHALGTWVDNGKHVLDVSIGVPDKADALRVANRAGQKAIYNLKSGELTETGAQGDKYVDVHHWSTREPALTETDPEHYGEGRAGAERQRAKEPGWIPRTYFGLDGFRAPEIQQGWYHRGRVNLADYYNMDEDPAGIWRENYKSTGLQSAPNAAESAVKRAGYKGYYSPQERVLVSYDNVPVKASGEKGFIPPNPNVAMPEHSTGYEQRGSEHHIVARNAEGKELGRLKFERSDDIGMGDTARVISSRISNPDLRGRGMGREMYDAAIAKAKELGYTYIGSDSSLSTPARHMWEALLRDHGVRNEPTEDSPYRFRISWPEQEGEVPSIEQEKEKSIQSRIVSSSAYEKALNKNPGAVGEPAEFVHMTPEERASAMRTTVGRRNTLANWEKLPAVQEFKDIALAGEGGRKWFQRSSAAIDALAAEAPEYFPQSEDKRRFIGLLAATSPRQSVAMNMREALTAWTKWIDAGRPTGKDLRKMLFRTLTNSKSKVSNAMNALEDRPLWPALSKNRSFKSPSFDKNLQGWLDYATNDCWMGLFGGVSETALSNPTSYHPLSVATRAAAYELTKEGMGDWKTAEAQAAIWTFTKVFQETGETDPAIVRQMSQDFADIMAHDSEVQDLLAQMGVKHEQLAARLEAIGEKPEITGRTTPTSSDSIKRLGERLEKAGRAAPERLAGTSFIPEELEEFEGKSFGQIATDGDLDTVPSLENVTVSKLDEQGNVVEGTQKDLGSVLRKLPKPLSRKTLPPPPSKGLNYPKNLLPEEAQDLQRLVQQMKERGASEKERQSFVDDWAKNARPKPVVPGLRSIIADAMDRVFNEKKTPMTPEQHAAAKNAAATPETKFRHAVHEVGHIIGAMGEGFPDHGGVKVGYQPVPDHLKEYANQLGTDIMGGAARIPAFPNTPQGRRAYVRTLMAGGVAEVMMTGTPTPGDYGDIQIATKFLKGLGMSDEAIDEELFQARAYLVKSFGPKVREIVQHAAQEVADHHYGSDVLPSILDHYLMGERYEDVMPQSPKR